MNGASQWPIAYAGWLGTSKVIIHSRTSRPGVWAGPCRHSCKNTRAYGNEQRADHADIFSRISKETDLNVLQTRLYTALRAEDYREAAALRDKISLVLGRRPSASWEDLGLPQWLADRARQLGYVLPAPVQGLAVPQILTGQDAWIASQTGSGKTLAFVLPALAIMDVPPAVYPDDLKGPQIVLVVPTRDLGVQLALVVYKLLGGSLDGGTLPGRGGETFRYWGPRGISVKGLVLPEEVDAARNSRTLLRAHVVIGTPELLAAAMKMPGGVAVTQFAKLIVIDEADACYQKFAAALAEIMAVAGGGSGRRCQRVVVGASLAGGLALKTFRRLGWLSRSAVACELVSVCAQAAAPSVSHIAIITATGVDGLTVLDEQLRAEFERWRDHESSPLRVIVVTSDEATARQVAHVLRDDLWDVARVVALLPHGHDALRIVESIHSGFAGVLVTVADAIRGLDLPGMRTIYCLGPPFSADEYMHTAGRLGRIGSDAGCRGRIVSIVREGPEASKLRAAAAGVHLIALEPGMARPQDEDTGLDQLHP